MPQPTEQGWPIPLVIDPVAKLCYKIKIPNEPNHRRAFFGALSTLAKWYNWKYTGNDLGSQAAQVWRVALGDAELCADCVDSLIYDLRQTGVLIERMNEIAGSWSTLYDPRPYVLLKTPTAIHQNTVSAAAGIAGLNLLSVVGERANADDAVLYVLAGWDAPAATFKRNDTTNTETIRIEHNLTGGVGESDFLRAMDTTGFKMSGINPFGNIALRRYTSLLPTASAAHYGSLAMLGNGSTENALWYCDYNAGTGTYYWRKGVGTPGEPGEPGDPGHNVDTLDPALQEVLNPNQPPEIVIDNALPSTTYVGWKLPRAPDIFLLPTTYSPAGSPITVAMSDDTNGDKNIQFDFPEIPESPGGHSDIDEQLPGLGETRDNYTIVMADSGTNAGIVLPTGVTITEIEPVGQWQVTDTFFSPIHEIVTSGNGVIDGSEPINQGKMLYGLKPEAGLQFDHYEYNELPVEVTAPTHLKFTQNRNGATTYGSGLLKVRYRLVRGNYTWGIRMPFESLEFAGKVYDQDSSCSWVSGDGYVTDGTFWYIRLSIGLKVTAASTLKQIVTRCESHYGSPGGSGWKNLDKVRTNVDGTLTDYNLPFSYPYSEKVRTMDTALAIHPLGNLMQVGFDAQNTDNVLAAGRMIEVIFRGTGQEPELVTF